MRIIVPTADVQRQADGVLGPIGDVIVRHRHEQRRLAASRDLLLPRLISGELSIAAAERELEAAA
jgi:type I restriction enzyme S subunit